MAWSNKELSESGAPRGARTDGGINGSAGKNVNSVNKNGSAAPTGGQPPERLTTPKGRPINPKIDVTPEEHSAAKKMIRDMKKELRQPRSSEAEKYGYLPKNVNTPKPEKVVKVAKVGTRSATKLQ